MNFHKRCRWHTVGVPPGARAFFVAGCEICEAKKAAGKVTGNEPAPVNMSKEVGVRTWTMKSRIDRARAAKKLRAGGAS